MKFFLFIFLLNKFIFSIKDDNRLGVWGSNSYGQLGVDLENVNYHDITINDLDFIKDSFCNDFYIVDIMTLPYRSYILVQDKPLDYNINNMVKNTKVNRRIFRLGFENTEFCFLKGKQTVKMNVIVSQFK